MNIISYKPDYIYKQQGETENILREEIITYF